MLPGDNVSWTMWQKQTADTLQWSLTFIETDVNRDEVAAVGEFLKSEETHTWS